MNFKYTNESLANAVKNFKDNGKPIPYYNSDDPRIRTQIGEVIDMKTNNGNLEYTVKMNDGTYIKGVKPKQ